MTAVEIALLALPNFLGDRPGDREDVQGSDLLSYDLLKAETSQALLLPLLSDSSLQYTAFGLRSAFL